jgi:hypothetical protein
MVEALALLASMPAPIGDTFTTQRQIPEGLNARFNSLEFQGL